MIIDELPKGWKHCCNSGFASIRSGWPPTEYGCTAKAVPVRVSTCYEIESSAPLCLHGPGDHLRHLGQGLGELCRREVAFIRRRRPWKRRPRQAPGPRARAGHRTPTRRRAAPGVRWPLGAARPGAESQPSCQCSARCRLPARSSRAASSGLRGAWRLGPRGAVPASGGRPTRRRDAAAAAAPSTSCVLAVVLRELRPGSSAASSTAWTRKR